MTRKLIATALTAIALTLVPAVASAAADPAANDFGKQHVAHHAQQQHFDGDHNPGIMHQGKSGWAAHHHGG